MVWFRTRLPVLYKEIFQKLKENGKDSHSRIEDGERDHQFSKMVGKKFCWRNTRWETAESPWVRIPPYHRIIKEVSNAL